jgi:apolipoprotein N-acyltransferase
MACERLWPLDQPRLRLPLLIVSGAGGAMAFPTSNFWLLAWVWLVPALLCALRRRPREALADGWLAGSVFFVALLRWLDYTFRHYSAIPWPVSWIPILALAAYCGLYVGAVAAAVAWLRARLGIGWALTGAPALWVAGEWGRGRLMEGFPWGLMGYSQHTALPVIQIAEFGGVYAVSLLVVAVNAAIAGAAALGWRRTAPGLAASALLLGASLGYGWSYLAAPPSGGAQRVKVAVIQPSIEQTLKWDPAHQAETMAIYESLTREAARARPALILWPETAAAIFLRGDPELLSRLTRLSAELGTPLLVGSLDRRPSPRDEFLNSAFFLTGQGIRAKYDKIHLVPFGEYVPLAGLIGFVRGWAEFISEFGAGEVPTVFPLAGAPFGTVICYEIVFPELVRGFVMAGALFMANITNDAWFGRTSGPWQHLGMVPLRAVEHRMAIARSANTGVSAFVDKAGRITGTLGLFERGVLVQEVELRARPTLYTRWGDWLPYLCMGLSAAALGGALLRRSSRPC